MNTHFLRSYVRTHGISSIGILSIALASFIAGISNAHASGCDAGFWREVDEECGYDRKACDTLDRRKTQSSVTFESTEAETAYKITQNPDGSFTCESIPTSSRG